MEFARHIPAIERIDDARLRAAVSLTWEATCERSRFDGPDDIPQSVHIPERSLLIHTNEVADMAVWMLDWSRDHFALTADRDVVLAAAILHDVDKLLAYQQTDEGEFVYATGWVPTRDHGPTGAAIARECGAPSEVTELVRLHSPFGDHEGLPSTAEGTIIHYSDLGAADLGAVAVNRVPVHERAKLVPC